MANPHSQVPPEQPPVEAAAAVADTQAVISAADRVSTLRFKSLALPELLLGDALLVNSRCLRFLALQRRRGPGTARGKRGDDLLLSDQALLELRDCVTRLASHWQLLSGTGARALAKQALARVQVIATEIPPGSATGRAAKELLEQTEDPKQRAALREIMDQWVLGKTARPDAAINRDRLLELLGQDAAAWQEAVDLVDTADAAPVIRALKVCYRKPRRLCKTLSAGTVTKTDTVTKADTATKTDTAAKIAQHDEISTTPDSSNTAAQQLAQLLEQVSRNVAQLELLRPALSDRYAKQLWYQQRLERNLRRRLDLSAFEQQLLAMELHSDQLLKVRERAQAAVRARGQVQTERTGKLISLAYGAKPRTYIDGITECLSALDDRPLTLSDSHLDSLTATHESSDAINLGDITIEEPQQP